MTPSRVRWRFGAKFMGESSVSRAAKRRYDSLEPKVPLLALRGGLLALEGARLRSQGRQELIHGQGIDDISRFQPAPARHGHPVPDELQMWRVVGIGVDHYLYSAFLAHAQVHVGQVQPIW